MPTPLDIKITTTADTAGIDQVNSALEKQKVTQERLTQEYKNEGQLASQRLEAAEKFTQKQREGGAAAKGLAGDLKGLQLAGQGANQVLNGMAQGSLAGLVQAARGAITVFRGLATGTIGAVLLPILAAAGLAFAALARKANENAAAIKKMYDDGDKSRTAYQNGLTELQRAAEASLKAQLADVKALADAYDALIGRMDEAAARVGRLRDAEQEAALSKIDRDEAEALSGALTSEQRDAVKASAAAARSGLKDKYGSAALESDVLNAKNREQVAQRKITEASTKQFEADKQVVAASQEYQTALGRISDLRGSPKQEDLLEAKLAKDRLELAKSNRDAIAEENGRTISAAEREIASARETTELAPLRSTTMKNRAAAESFNRQSPINVRVTNRENRPSADVPGLERRYGELDQQLQSVTRGDFGRENSIVAEMENIRGQLSTASQAMKDIGQGTKKLADNSSETERAIRNTAESRAGQ